MAADYTIRGDTRLDAGGFNDGLGKISSLAKAGLGALAATAAAAVAAVGAVSISSVKLASDLTEVQNVVDVTFGDNADTINSWAEAADTSYGLSVLAAKQYTGTLGAMLKSMGVTDDAVLQMSTDMVGLAGDFASFYNLDAADAFEKIRSGISGETEPLKQLGINMSVANLEAFALAEGIDKSYDSMTQAEQATLRYNYLMSVSADAQGDFVRTQDSLANQVRIAQLQIQELSATIGTALLPMAQQGAQALNGMLSSIREGLDTGGIEGMFSAISTSVTQLSSMIAGQAPAVASAAVGLLSALIQGIIGAAPALLSAGAQIVTAIGQAIVANGPQLLASFMQLFQTISSAVVTYGPQFYASIMSLLQQAVTAFSTYGPTLIQQGASMVLQLAQGVAQNIPSFLQQALPLVLQFTQGLRANFGALVDAGLELILTLAKGLIKGLPTLIEYVPEIITNIAGLINDNAPKVLKAGVELIVALVEGIVQSIPTIVSNLPKIIDAIVAVFTAFNWVSLGKNIITLLKDGITGMIGAVKTAGQNVFDAVKNVIAKLPSTLQSLGQSAGSMLSGGLRGLLGSVTGAASSLFSAVRGALTSLPGVLQSLGRSAGSLLSGGLSGMVGAVRGAASSILSAIQSTLTSLPSKLFSLAQSAVTRMAGAFKTQNWASIGANVINGIISGIGSAVSGLVDSAVSAAKSAFNAAKNALGIHSPSRLFRDEIGKMIPAGIAVGIEADTPEAIASVDALVSRMTAAAQIAADAMQTKAAATVAVVPPEEPDENPDKPDDKGPVPVVQEFNFNYPVQAPDEIAREIRIRETYGLGGDR